MAREDKSKQYYKRVAILTQDAYYDTVPDGETWEIQEFHGDSNPNVDTYVALIWDYGTVNEQIIALGYGSVTRKLYQSVVGDGVKKLAIVLANNSANIEALGAAYTAFKE